MAATYESVTKAAQTPGLSAEQSAALSKVATSLQPSYSSEKGQQLVQDANKNLATIATPTQTQAATSKTTPSGGLSLQETTSIFGDDFSGVNQNDDGTYTPSIDALGRVGVKTAQTPAQIAMDTAKKEYQSLLNQLQKVTGSGIDTSGIAASWDARIKEMEQINQSRQAAITQTGIRSGSRWTGGSGGVWGSIIAGEEIAGVQRVSALEKQKQAAILEAQQAAEDRNWNKYVQSVGIARNHYLDQLEELKEINKLQAEQDKKIREKRIQASRDSALADLFAQGITDPMKALTLLNYDENGDLVGDFTAKEIKDAYNVFQGSNMDNMTDDQIEYEYAVAQGYTGTFMNYKNSMRAPIPGTPSSVLEFQYAQSNPEYAAFMQKEKPATAAQQTLGTYASRVEQSNPTISKFANTIAKMNPLQFEAYKNLPSYLQSAEFQQFDQAARNFINAVLRRESGAVISPSEFDNAYKQYLPRAGDTPETLKQKQVNREIAYQTFKKGAGSAYTPLDELLGTDGAPTTKQGTGPNGETMEWDDLSPEDQRVLEDNGWTIN